MATDAKSTNQALNRLIEYCHDGHDGYQIAARYVRDREVKLEMGRYALERKEFRDRLARKVDRHYGAPPEHGTVKGALHRSWIDLKTMVKELSTEDILQECVRGEEEAIHAYEEALAVELVDELKDLITHQLGMIVKARNHLARRAGLEAP